MKLISFLARYLFRYYACLCGHHELVEFLLQNGEFVSFDCKQRRGESRWGRPRGEIIGGGNPAVIGVGSLREAKRDS